MFQQPITAAVFDPDDFHGTRARLSAETQGDYGRFKRSLHPDFARVARDVVLGYAALALTLMAVAVVDGVGAGLAAAAVGAVSIGYWIAYLQLFIHEAAHFNLARDKRLNDRIANLLICWQVGTDIASYRRTHSDHHRFLGAARDTEISYTHPLTPRFLLEMATGIHAARVFLDRKRSADAEAPARNIVSLLRGVVVHLLLLAVLAAAGAWAAMLAWIVGVGVMFPVFATVRQLLEHRPAESGENVTAVTRMFGDDAFSRTFGGAGFNRHFLHHLEPQVSYTRLAEFENYLMKTSFMDALESRRSTYAGVFAALLKDGRNG